MKSHFFALLTLLVSADASAQTVAYLASFGPNGFQPSGPLAQGLDGNLYGSTFEGSPQLCPNGSSCGTIYKMTPGGTLTTVHNFVLTDGDFSGGLVLASDGNFYGATGGGGANVIGTVFRLTPAGQFTTIYRFSSQQKQVPNNGVLIQAGDGNLYGATYSGGASSGTIYRLTLTGELTTLFAFRGNHYYPNSMLQATDGNLYGTTNSGGISYNGTIFKIALSGGLTTIAYLNGPIEENVPGGLLQGNNGKLYGTAATGVERGAIFELTTGGAMTVIQTCASTCSEPNGVIQGTDGNLYGTSIQGGLSGNGSLFEITPSGKYASLFDFTNTSFYYPQTPLFQATDGKFYGTTALGGPAGDGNVFSLSSGLAPFVIPVPSVGKVGEKVRLLGSDLTGCISVTFNGVQTTFQVVSPTQLIANVPAGATSGNIIVVAPIGKLSSNVAFRVAQ